MVKRIKCLEHFEEKGKCREECKDVFSERMLKNGRAVFLSDGVTSKTRAVQGAEEVHNTLASMIAGLRDEEISPENLKFRTACSIRETMYLLENKEQVERAEYAATLICLFFPTGRDSFFIIHLGDGVVCSQNRMSMSLNVISLPSNGLTREYTYTTAMVQGLYDHIRVREVQMSEADVVYVMTDGVSDVIFEDLIEFDLKKDFKEVLSLDGITLFKEYLMRKEPQDDVGFAAVYLE